MKRLKKLLALICALVLCLSLAACSGGGNGGNGGGSGSSGGSGDISIAYIPKERNESFWQAVEAGAQQAAKDRGVNLIIKTISLHNSACPAYRVRTIQSYLTDFPLIE